jgi:RNA polymerase sigma-70 factor (ECF subfamily)
MADSQEELMQALHDEHAAALWNFCLRLTHGDRTRAEDLVQETLLRAWRTPRVLDQSSGSARSWLFTVARHLMIDEWRSAHAQRELPQAEPPERPTADAVDSMLESWLVADAISTLSAEHRAVLVECYYRGRSVAEAARALEVPEGTVKSRTHYALRALRLTLQEMGVTS